MHYLKSTNPFGILFLAFASMLLVSSCATTKKRGDVSKLGKLWHNMNSKYNAHYNAEVLLDETLLAIDQGQQDIYSEVLPIYNYIDIENAEQYYEDMDKAIEKSAISISIHRPSHWTDDHYFVMAKAQFLKKDYESAEATLRYLTKHYDPDNIVKASQSQTRARNSAERKFQSKEKAKKNKVAKKEREDKIKERRKEVQKARKKRSKKSQKARDRERQARIKERKQQIKDRSTLAKSKTTADTETEKEAEKAVASDEPKRKKKQEPFDQDPELPKVKGTEDNYFLKHKPVHQEAQLWLAKTLIERDRFGEAATILRNLERDKKTFEEIREEAYIVHAYSALRRDLYDAAIEPLLKSMELIKDRSRKARLAFILAQLQERAKQYAGAGESYDEVVRLKPGYEMSFNAELNKAIMFWTAGSMAGKEFERDLTRMIKDDKNSEYRDQLYYALGQKSLKEGNADEAIRNFSLAVRNSVGNTAQKTEAYYAIADLYFGREQYIEAKNYFDSTLAVMSKVDPRFPEVENYSKSLSGIASNLSEIQLQDSMIALSQLSEKELRKMANQIKKERAKAEAIKQAASSSGQPGRATLSQTSQLASAGAPESNFFAYNEKILKKGQRDFDRDWGGATLEDNWRRSNKSTISIANNEEGEEVEEGAAISQTEVEEIFADVPQTDEELAAAHKKIEDALFEVGRLFRSELSNSKKSISSLEKLLDSYPETEHRLDAYYLLYVTHNEGGNNAKARTYSDLILKDFPDSDYAAYIKDPTLLQNLESEEEKVQSFYMGVYALYEGGEVEEAFDKLGTSGKTFGTKHPLQSKFAFLTALCVGRLQGREPYINALKELIAKYPKTDEEKEAKEIIRLLGVRFADTQDGVEEINPDAYFKIEPNDKLHFVLVPVRTNENINQGRIDIADYNKKYHKLDQLTIGMIVLDDGIKKVPTYVVRRFNDREKAMAYYEGVQKNQADFIAKTDSYEIFVASQRNYRKVVQLKSIDLYREFFVREYLSR